MKYTIALKSSVPRDLVTCIAGIDEFKGRWEALKNLAPDRLALLRKVATIASIGSSTRIEGALLTDAQVEVLLLNVKKQAFASRDEEEVAGYADAMNLVFESFADIPITENHIKQLHGTLLKYSTKDQRHRGDYKKTPNSVEAFDADGKRIGVVFETASPFETPFFMKSLVAWYAGEAAAHRCHPLILIGAFIVHFLAIHPFQDGNGRLSRVLTTLMLLREGYLYVPYCSLESIIEGNREQYYRSLRKAQVSFKSGHEGMDEWLRYFLKTLRIQKEILEKRLEQERLSALSELTSLSVAILNHARTHAKTAISDMVARTRANRNTIKKHVKNLVEKGHLDQHGTGKGTWYSVK